MPTRLNLHIKQKNLNFRDRFGATDLWEFIVDLVIGNTSSMLLVTLAKHYVTYIMVTAVRASATSLYPYYNEEELYTKLIFCAMNITSIIIMLLTSTYHATTIRVCYL